MNDMSGAVSATPSPLAEVKESDLSARDWVRVLAKYREPNTKRSLWELAVTAVPLVILFVAARLVLPISIWLTIALCVIAAGFLVRLFIIQHDCGHASMFKSRAVNDWVGRLLGVVTLTPYDIWKRSHAIHHSAAGNLDKRGVGDIYTMTVREYLESPTWRRWWYRIYRHPITLFMFGPVLIFGLFNRFPVGSLTGKLFWLSSMGTNVALVLFSALMMWIMGWWQFTLIFGLISFGGAAIGMWLFYVQHQFEGVEWDENEEWDLHDSALFGSSFYDLPTPLRWISGNIGIHHVHHLYSRIPFYRLTEVLRDHPVLKNIRRMTFRESLRCVRLHLWDENERRMIGFSDLRA